MATLAFAPSKDLTEETNIKDVAYELGECRQRWSRRRIVRLTNVPILVHRPPRPRRLHRLYKSFSH